MQYNMIGIYSRTFRNVSILFKKNRSVPWQQTQRLFPNSENKGYTSNPRHSLS